VGRVLLSLEKRDHILHPCVEISFKYPYFYCLINGQFSKSVTQTPRVYTFPNFITNLCYFSVYPTFTNLGSASYLPFCSLFVFVHIFRLIVIDSFGFIPLVHCYSWKSAVRIRSVNNKKCKGKAVPLQAWSGPECSSKLRFPDF